VFRRAREAEDSAAKAVADAEELAALTLTESEEKAAEVLRSAQEKATALRKEAEELARKAEEDRDESASLLRDAQEKLNAAEQESATTIAGAKMVARRKAGELIAEAEKQATETTSTAETLANETMKAADDHAERVAREADECHRHLVRPRVGEELDGHRGERGAALRLVAHDGDHAGGGLHVDQDPATPVRSDADQASRYVEGAARAMRLQQLRARCHGALRKIVEGKADHRRRIAHLERTGVQMHRQPMADLHSRL